jgi:thymidylate synthase (FAD)
MTIDSRFAVATVSSTNEPQRTIWAAMHQDYSEEFVGTDLANRPEESKAGDLLIKHLLAGERGHYGPLEHAQIVLAVGWFPHSVMQQARTHRVGVSFDVQSGRYTSKRIMDVALGTRDIEEVFYLRPVGIYMDRSGDKYEYTQDQRIIDVARCYDAAGHYAYRIRQGMSEEHARDLVPYAIRQHFVVSFSLRALMHFLDLRAKRDAQLEIRQLCDLIRPAFELWTPEIAKWYLSKRWGKAKLAP